jgi:hypothetical protein
MYNNTCCICSGSARQWVVEMQGMYVIDSEHSAVKQPRWLLVSFQPLFLRWYNWNHGYISNSNAWPCFACTMQHTRVGKSMVTPEGSVEVYVTPDPHLMKEHQGLKVPQLVRPGCVC